MTTEAFESFQAASIFFLISEPSISYDFRTALPFTHDINNCSVYRSGSATPAGRPCAEVRGLGRASRAQTERSSARCRRRRGAPAAPPRSIAPAHITRARLREAPSPAGLHIEGPGGAKRRAPRRARRAEADSGVSSPGNFSVTGTRPAHPAQPAVVRRRAPHSAPLVERVTGRSRPDPDEERTPQGTARSASSPMWGGRSRSGSAAHRGSRRRLPAARRTAQPQCAAASELSALPGHTICSCSTLARPRHASDQADRIVGGSAAGRRCRTETRGRAGALADASAIPRACLVTRPCWSRVPGSTPSGAPFLVE